MEKVIHQTYFAYIVECSDGTYYVGKTLDITQRIRQHNGEIGGGGKYTRARRPVVLRYVEQFDSHLSACRREASLKKLTRLQKQSLIEGEARLTDGILKRFTQHPTPDSTR